MKGSATMNDNFWRFVAAIAFLALGVTLLLVNLGVWDVNLSTVLSYLYPAIFVLYGGKVVVDSLLRMQRSRRVNLSWLWGGTLLTVGALLILSRLGHGNFTLGMVLRFWPVFLVYLGLSILIERDTDWNPVESGVWFSTSEADNGPELASSKEQWTRTGKTERFGPSNWTVGPMRLTGAVVDYRFDFSEAHIPEGETPIELVGAIADIKMLIPRGVEFAVRARGTLGDIHVAGQEREGLHPKVEYRTEGFDEAQRRLTFLIDYQIIDLRVDRV